MPASLGRISCNVGPLYTGLISTLLNLARSRHNLTLQFALGTSMMLLHHSDVLSKPRGTIIYCFCNLSSSCFRGSWSGYTSILKGPDEAGCCPSPVN